MKNPRSFAPQLILALNLLIFSRFPSSAQTNIISTDPLAEQILMGKYDPAAFASPLAADHPDTIVRGMNARVSGDSLRRYLEILATFYNRNTGSDTASALKGIGAARRWVMGKFAEFSAASANRLIPSYLQFDTAICGITRHRNIFAVLPGVDTSDKSIVLIEGHLDSRCAGLCDTACMAQGMEDNGSGTALVLELARVMSRYRYNHTLAFVVTTGEEQGLYGAQAFATYAKQKGMAIRSALNNDIVGGVICGKTSSPPGCPGFGNVDSTQVRMFSSGGFNSPHKGLARFVKLEYKEELLPIVRIPMLLSVMSAEDRTNRGGDHIPFRQNGFTAIRFTSANEHGDASNGTGYTDRQHGSRDVLGVDTNSDNALDSFYVDFNYLARNCVINGTGAGLIGIGPKTPDFQLTLAAPNKLIVQITQQTQYGQYRIGLRTTTNDWDSVYTIAGRLGDTIPVGAAAAYYVSVASVDGNGIESLFSRELVQSVSGVTAPPEQGGGGLELMQNRPNPFDEATIITVLRGRSLQYRTAAIVITDVAGRIVSELPIDLHNAVNEVVYTHGYNMSGTYVYTLMVDGRIVGSRKMIFAN